MPNTAPNARWAGYLFLAVTCAGWAMNWPVIKLLLREWPPLFSRGIAGVAAGLLLALIAVTRGETLRMPRHAVTPLLFASFTNVFAWMGFATMAIKWLSISEAALLVYTMPIWATLFAWPILGTRPTLRAVAALLLGLTGILVLLGAHGLALSPDKLIGIALALGSATMFALGGVLTKSPLPLPPTALVAWQVGLGCAPMIVLGLLFEHPDPAALTATGAAALAYMTLGPMGVCYLTWFATLRRLPPATAATGTLIVPVLGVIAAAVVLGEPLGLREAVAMAITLGGVLLALRKPAVDAGSAT
jgi:drug/metabolite transporter (DMT)-like permease